MTPCGTVQVLVPVDVNRSTTYFVPLTPIVPLPVKDVRPPDAMLVFVTVMLRVLVVAFVLPAVSENEPDATVTTAVPSTDEAAVNVAV